MGDLVSFGFTSKDLVRSAYAFLWAALASLLVVSPSNGNEWKVAAVGAVAAGLAAVKNYVFRDGTLAKG